MNIKTLIAFFAGIFLIFPLAACQPYTGPAVDAWVFCGVNPSDPKAQIKANAMALVAGVDASLGPCLAPPADYTAAFPGSRYLSPEVYLNLTVINANAGMKTVPYDARLWSDDPAVRGQAIEFWRPHTAWLRAFDMGDEFDPNGPEWSILIHRWDNMIKYVMPELGVGPFTNHMPTSLDAALRDLPLASAHLSFDQYDVPGAVATAETYAPSALHLMCAINALPHGSFNPTPKSIEDDMKSLRRAGCDSILIFGGEKPEGGLIPFTKPSLVNANGTPTPFAAAVLRGSK
jgi:hypothetical protein